MTMYLEHFGLHEPPFRITPHTEFFYAGANRGATLEALLYAITAGEGLVKVAGEVGSGKTMLCRMLMERLPASVEMIYLAVPSLTRDEMLAAIATDLGLDVAGANTTQMLRALQEKLIALHSDGKQVVALIDEAHAMPLPTLEEVRLLSNLETGTDKLLQIVLFGQPELDQHLALPNMRQLKERITHSFALAPLGRADTREYVNFRLRAAGYHGPELFGDEALAIIAEASEGLTRRINIFADKTLLAAFAAGTHSVSADHARAAISDTQIVIERRAPRRRIAMAAALGFAAGVAIGFGSAQWLASPQTTLVAAPAEAAAPARPTASVLPVAATLPAPEAAPRAEASAPRSESSFASLNSRLAAGRDLLADGGRARYSVQLMVTDARERGYLETYLAEAGHVVDPARLFVVPAGNPELPRVAVLYGAFGERGDAASALEGLPPGLRQFRPYVRPIEAIRDDARQAGPR
jgi:MSHA biogenesis protein MshM